MNRSCPDRPPLRRGRPRLRPGFATATALAMLLAAFIPGRAAASVVFPWSSEAERVRGWEGDLDSVLTAYLPKDRSFDPEARARFTEDIRTLRASVTHLSDEQLVVKLATAVAGANNAHTRLYTLRNRASLRRYPIRVWWFGQDLAIVRAKPGHEDLVGGTIVTIAGMSPASLAERVKPLYASNASWARYMSTYLLTSPEILKGVDVLKGDDSLEVVVETRAGTRRTVRLAPMPFERSDKPTEAWWDLAPTHPGAQGPWVSALPSDSTKLPLYLQRLSRWYWTQELPGKTLYLQYNRAQDQPEFETVREFAARVLAGLEVTPPQKLVIDLRFNTGGNLDLADPFFRGVAALPLAKERGRLFVITGRTTFSAGISAVAVLRELSKVVIVGEPVGDVLETWSEGGNVLLPNTKLTMHYTDGFHSYTPREYPDRKPYRGPDLSITEVGPDVPVETTLAQYLAGKDPALDAVRKFRR